MIDVSHTVDHGMITYRGLPAPITCEWLSRKASRARYAPGTEFQIGTIELMKLCHAKDFRSSPRLA